MLHLLYLMTEAGIFISTSLLQQLNALFPIFITEFGISIFSKQLHKLKAKSPISITELGIFMLFNCIQ